MNFTDLFDAWASAEKPALAPEAYSIRLNVADAARVQAFAELYPGTDADRVISDLLSLALDQAEAAIPYVPGSKVIREDEFGDPVYEDAGLTPKYLELVKKHARALRD